MMHSIAVLGRCYATNKSWLVLVTTALTISISLAVVVIIFIV